jgi:hypothetical protein
MSVRIMLGIIVVVFILMSGCSMDKKSDIHLEDGFNQEALYIIELLRICMNQFGLPENIRTRINEFFEEDHSESQKHIIKGISSVYMAFLGKTNFGDKEDAKNKELFEKLSFELSLIEGELK